MPDHAHSLSNLSTILLIFSVAGILVPIFQKIKISPILGYLICGLFIGPFGLARFQNSFPQVSYFTISDVSTVGLLGEIGIVFLMFMIGLELSIQRLFDMRKLVLGLGTAQIVLTSLVISGFVIAFGNAFQVAMIVGLSFALSSTAIVMQLLQDQHLANRPTGMVAFSILLMQDLAIVPLLVILGALVPNESETGNLFMVLVKSLIIAVSVVVSIYMIGKKIIKPLLSYLSLAKNPEWLVSLVFLLAIGSAVLTQSFGLSAALGAFLAGLVISETDFKHEVEVIIEPVKSLLLGIFFLSVGMQVNPEVILAHPVWIPVSVLGLFFVKVACLYPLNRAFHLPKAKSMDVAIRMAQAGEFALLMLGIAISSGLIEQGVGDFFLMIAILSLFATPALTNTAPYVIRKLRLNSVTSPPGTSDFMSVYHENPSIIIAGYGRVGRLIGGILENLEIPFIAIDQNYEKVRILRNSGHRVMYADARKIGIWKKFDIETLKAVIIAVDQPDAADMILKGLREEWPNLPIIVRTHDTVHMEHLFSIGATEAIPEALETSLIIATKALSLIGIDKGQIAVEMERERQMAKLKHVDVE